MKLFTKAIEAKAQAQFHLGADMEKQVLGAKFFVLNKLLKVKLQIDQGDISYC